MNTQTVGRPMEILLVEDNLLDARLTLESLRRSSVKHRLTLVRDGEEAVDFLYRNGKFKNAPRPDLILLDLQLPKRDGREVLSIVKEDDELRPIPIVILTASEAHEDIVRSEQLEVDSYMTKPVDFEQFLKVIRELKNCWMADVIIPSAE